MSNRPRSVTTTLVFILLDALFWLAFGVIVAANIHPGLPDLPFIKEITAFLAFATAGILLLLFASLGKRNRMGYFLGLGLFGILSILTIFDDFGWSDLVVLTFQIVPLILLIKDRTWYLQSKPLYKEERRKEISEVIGYSGGLSDPNWEIEREKARKAFFERKDVIIPSYKEEKRNEIPKLIASSGGFSNPKYEMEREKARKAFFERKDVIIPSYKEKKPKKYVPLKPISGVSSAAKSSKKESSQKGMGDRQRGIRSLEDEEEATIHLPPGIFQRSKPSEPKDKSVKGLNTADLDHPAFLRKPIKLPDPLQNHKINRISTESGSDPVDCTVLAPPDAGINTTILVQVFLHTTDQTEAVKTLAKEFDKQSQRLGYHPLEIDLARGTPVMVELVIPKMMIDDPLQRVTWQGRTTSVQFGVSIPAEASPGTVVGKVTVFVETIPIGHIKFKLEVNSENRIVNPAPQATGSEAKRYKEAFISYSSKDRDEVLKRVQMLERFHIQIFQDILSLEPGVKWEKELYQHIDQCDLFLLFWSSAAKESTWVDKEVRHALARKGNDESAPPEIVPIVIEGPPVPLPPPHLAHLHFNDRLLYFMTSKTKRASP